MKEAVRSRAIHGATLLAALSLALCGCTGLKGQGVGGQTDKDRLQGTWTAVSLETDGVAAPADAARRVVWKFTGDGLVIKGAFGDQREVPCTFQIQPGQNPKTIDYTPAGSPGPLRGIYELDGDRLKVCLVNGKGERPREFASQAGTGLSLIVLTRSK
jgi:uncharacterized protein (TIGR03067 family)